MSEVRWLSRSTWLWLACAACIGDGDRPSMYGCGGLGHDSAVEVLWPNGGEVWSKSRAVRIEWRANEEIERVRIVLLDGDVSVATIAESEPNEGVLEGYRLPAGLPERDGYRVRVSDVDDDDVADVSDGDFRIETRDVSLTGPNGGESVLAGAPVAIAWSTIGSIGAVDLQLVSDGGVVAVIEEGVPNSGELVWTPSFSLPPRDDYRVQIVDPESRIDDTSDGVFLLDNWRFRRPITFVSPSSTQDIAATLLVEIDPSDPVFDHAAADGSDIRFASDAERSTGHDVAHYTEQWSSVAGARIWVRIPVVPDSELALQMFYGAPTAPSASDIDAVFPNRFRSSGDFSLGGVHEYDTFRLRESDALHVEPGAPLEIRARVIEIEGWLDGNGAGYPGAADGYVGPGPGGGGTSTTGGGGGAGYGGYGGYGGYDSGDAPGSAGPTYGGSTGSDLDMGSGGGASDVHRGGDGGGAISLRAHTVVITGWVEVDGFSGESCVSSRCGGGGSGGGILIAAHEIHLTGELSASGGHGGDGYGTTDDGGGGGGGGRIKLFYGGALEDAGLVSVTGGEGGIARSEGQAGGNGTTHLQAQARWEPTSTLGSEEALFP